jgi:hypothetical protein
MAKETIILAQLDLDVDGLLKSATASKTAITQLISELTVLKSTGEESSAQFRKMQDDMQKLTQVFDAQIKAIKEQIKKNDDLADAQKSVTKAVNKTVNAQEELAGTYATAAGALEEFEQTSRNAAATLQNVNAGLKENKNLMAQGSTAVAEHGKTFNDYKEQVAGAVADLNIFNGGLGGLMSRMDEAGGAGPLLSKSFQSISEGIGGMTKSSLAFIATPMGAVIAAIGLVLNSVISYFSDTQEGIDKVTAVTRPLQAVFQALMGVFQNVGKFLVDAFSSPQKSMSKFGDILKGGIMTSLKGMMELVPALGKAVDLLFKGEFSKAGKVAADAVGKVLLGTDNITGKIADAAAGTGKFLSDAYNNGKRLDTLQKELDKGLADYTKKSADYTLELNKQNAIADNGNKTFAQRETAATRALVTLKEQNKLMEDRVAKELEVLKLKLAADGLTDAENAQIAEMTAKKEAAHAQNVQGEKAQAGKIKSIKNEEAAHYAQLRQQALDDAVTKQKLGIDLYMAQQDGKVKSLEDELKVNENLYQQKIKLAQKEYNASKKTAFDKTRLQIEQTKITNEFLQKQTDLVVTNAEKELNAITVTNQKKLESSIFLTDELYELELERLSTLQVAELDFEKVKLDNKKISQEEYNAAISAIDEKYINERENLTEEKKQDERDKEVIDLENKRIAQGVAFQYDVDAQLKEYDTKRAIERENALKSGADMVEFDKATAKERKDIEFQVYQNKLSLAASTFANIATIMGKESAAGKAIAVAQATIDTYKSAISAFDAMAGIPVVGPTLGAVAAGAAIASGMANVKKITSTKTPKAEKGALFNIGGNRHSAGGTLFHGADGTAFEAEQGELIGVMNRNAARHFMAFNNAFPAGGAAAPNYFAGGGIVSREITPQGLNIDELAGKIAEANRAIPAPVVAVQDIINEGNSYVRVRDGANF